MYMNNSAFNARKEKDQQNSIWDVSAKLTSAIITCWQMATTSSLYNRDKKKIIRKWNIELDKWHKKGSVLVTDMWKGAGLLANETSIFKKFYTFMYGEKKKNKLSYYSPSWCIILTMTAYLSKWAKQSINEVYVCASLPESLYAKVINRAQSPFQYLYTDTFYKASIRLFIVLG